MATALEDVLDPSLEIISGKLGLAVSRPLPLPSYTTTARDALTGMQAGWLIWNTTTSRLNIYNGSAWQEDS